MSEPRPDRTARFPLALERLGTEAATSPAREPLRPQRLLREAAQDAARHVAPTGVGLDSALVRHRMVERLRAEGVCGEAVLTAMAAVPRHLFVDSALAIQAYEDTSLPIGHGQTISKPSVVARMLGLLFEGESARRLGHLGRTLEIGTGCGYQAALLARLAPEVVTIERLAALFDRARDRLATMDLAHMTVRHGDGMLGLPQRAPYQSIVAAAGGDELPDAWLDQLAIGGRLVAPMRQAGGNAQVLMVVDKGPGGKVRQRAHDGVLFVPLKSGAA
ncbi:protein-L-isoaspartate(D-aspartate) O-methyltransferase [Ideonella sp. A 288]|uniref:protein-L-isoaspartate(D-aspartate) O-methyltransferase n=1 Tax=Ideonella sp. A 288 TaxID=1962181 RepID=UPI000B4B9845|nr:protein-L-isoaspartate(D-aspartate) O-methyltransferase [Ideonella sp. A 288]